MTKTNYSQLSRSARLFLYVFNRIIHRLFLIEKSGLPEKITSPMLIVVNHRRDADIPILGVFLGRMKKTQLTGILPHFVAREDLFWDDFLWRYWSSYWLIIPKLLSPLIPLKRILSLFKAHPIHRIREQSLATVLKDISETLGDRSLKNTLNRRWLKRFEKKELNTSRSISQFVNLETIYPELLGGEWGHRRLNLETFRQFKPYEKRKIAEHLNVFVQLLNDGENVMIAPEGANSPTGYFQAPRAGVYSLLTETREKPTILPVGLAYDPSFPGRSRVFIHAGNPFNPRDFSQRTTLDTEIAKRILQSTTITGTHLLAQYVLSANPDEELTEKSFENMALNLKQRLTQHGFLVADDAAQHASKRFYWLAKKGFIIRRNNAWFRINASEPLPGWESPEALTVFLRNELRSIISTNPELASNLNLPQPPYAPWST